MGFLEFLQSVASGQTPSNPLARRVAQQAVDAQHPTLMGRDVSGVPVLSGVIRPAVEALNTAGVIGEGAQRVAEATTGAGLAGLGAANRAGLLGMTRANQGELAQLLGGTSGNPLERAMQVNQRAQATVPGMGLVTAVVNPLNLTGPVGEAGAGLRAAEGAPVALRALGTALEGASAVGRAGMLPYEGAFGALGGLFKGVKNAVAPAASEAAPALAAAVDGGAAALPAALSPPAPAAPAFGKATLNLLATKGIDPAKLAGLDADLAQYVAENAGPGQEDALIAALRGEAPATTPAAALTAPETPPPAATPPAGPPSLAGIAPETGTPGPDWTHYGPETIYPGEGVTPELLDRFARLRQFPNPSPLDVNAEIGAMRDPVTLLQQTYGDQWQNRLAALTGGKWGQPGSGATLVNGRVMLGDLDLTTALRDYLENRGGPQAGDFKGALKALLPGPGLPTPAEAPPSPSAPPAAPTGTLEAAPATAWPTSRPDFDAMTLDVQKTGYGGTGTTRAGEAVTPDTTLIVYHGTDEQGAANLMKYGVDPQRKPGNLARDNYEAGRPAEFAPGRGVSGGIYVAADPFQASQFGPVTVAIRVPAKDILPSPEQIRLGSPGYEATGLGSLRDNDAIIARPVDLADMYLVGSDRKKYFRLDDAFAALPKTEVPPVSAAPSAFTGTLDDVRNLILGEAKRVNTRYPPLDPAFYAKRANVDPARVPAMLDQLVQEGTLGRLPDGSLAVKPGAGAAEAAPTVAAAAPAAPAAGSNEQRVIGMAALKGGTPTLGEIQAEFKVGASEALRLQDVAAGRVAPTPTGGDLAAGGGGFGLVPLSTGRVVGGLGGTLVGGGVGFAAPAPDTETRMKRAATGALLGGTLGTGLGSTAQGEALAEEALAGNRAAWQAGSKDIRPTSIGNAVSVIRAPQKTALMTIPRNIMDNTIKQALGGKNPLTYLGDLLAQSREWGTLLPDLRNAGDEQQRMHLMLSSLGPDFANRDPESMARLAVKQGMDYNLDPEDLGTAGAHPLVSAGRGAIGALTQPTKLLATGFLTPAAGAAEGLTLAGRAALQSAALTPADMIGRFAFSMPDYTRQLADAAPAFIKKVAASGQSTALLDQEGRFGASLIKDPTLRAEWEATQHAAEDAGAAQALDHMGDFGTHGAFRRIVNNAFPGGVWNIGQGQLLARRAAEHPQVALGAIRAAQESYRAALAAGHPEDAGTATIDDRTPGVGLLARLMNGGAAGVAHIPLTYSGSPIGPEILDVPRQLDPYLHPNQQLYDQIKTLTGALGLGANPALDMAAYRLGISDTPHAAASRWAPLGTYAEQVAHQAGVPGLGALTENPIADLLSPDAKPGDVKQQLRTNRYLDPAAITAGNEMIYELRGTSSSDPKNVDLVAQLRDPNSDFYRAALERGLGAKAGQALVNEVVPGHPQAQTATAYAAEAARTALLNAGLPLTKAQIQEIAARPDGGVVLSQIRQAQFDAAKLANPVLAVQDVGTAKALGEKAFQQWERENGGLAGFPIVYNILAQREQERLGLVPLGTAMAQQQAYDQLQAGQAYGRPQPYPGVQPPPFDPQPLYDLYRLFGGGR